MKKYEYFPHDDRILVEQMDVDDTSAGGIIVSVGKEKAFMGKVLKVGLGKRNDDNTRKHMLVKPGDIVVFGKYAGMETRLNDDKLLVMKEDDVIAIAVEVGADKCKHEQDSWFDIVANGTRCSECGEVLE